MHVPRLPSGLLYLLPESWRLARLRATAPAGPLADFYAAGFPPAGCRADALPAIALDLETTGGDPRCDGIVSFGWVCLDGTLIDLASARHCLVRPEEEEGGVMDGTAGKAGLSPASVVVHGITDDEAASGAALAEVLRDFLAAARGRVLIAHYAATETRFLAAACHRVFGTADFYMPAVDTLQLARARLPADAPPARGALRLGALRTRHNLPRYPAHNALSDALAAAELFLAQTAVDEGSAPATLADLRYRW